MIHSYQFSSIMKEIETEVNQRTAGQLSVNEDVLLWQMPSARSHRQCGHFVVKPILLSLIGELEFSFDRIPDVDLSTDLVGPGG